MFEAIERFLFAFLSSGKKYTEKASICLWKSIPHCIEVGAEAITISDLGPGQYCRRGSPKDKTSISAVIRSRSRTGEKDGKKEEEAVQALVLVSAA